MYPFFEVFWIKVYLFGLTLTLCFFLFMWMLKRLSHRFGVNEAFFFNKLLWYFLATFICSRLFYVIANWNNFKFIKQPIEFFIMSDYNFSLIGALFGFFAILYFSLLKWWIRSGKYIDVSILSFLFASVLGYIWAFFGGQVYGKETSIGIEVLYTNPFSPVPYEVPIFPLAILYAILFFILFCGLYMSAMFVSVRGIIGYMWVALIGCILLGGEALSGKYDAFKLYVGLDFTQIGAVMLILFGFHGLYRIYKTPRSNDML